MSKPSRVTIRDYTGGGAVTSFPATGLSHDIWNNALADSIQGYTENISKWAAGDIVQAEDYATISALVTAIGSAQKTVILASSINASNTAEAVTIPINISLYPIRPGVINKGSATSLTINAPVVGNPMHQWLSGFSGTGGDIGFAPGVIEAFCPQWLGAIPGSGADQATNAIVLQRTLNMIVAMMQAGTRPLPPILLTGKFYYSGAGLTIATALGENVTGLTIEGVSGGTWRANAGVEDRWPGLHYTGSGIAFTAGAATDVAFVHSSMFRNWHLTGTVSATGGFLADEVHASFFENFSCAGFSNSVAQAYGHKNIRGIGNIYINCAFYGNYDGAVIGRNNNTFYSSSFRFNTHYGLKDSDSRKLTLIDCGIEQNTSGGVYINNTSSGGYFTMLGGWVEGNGGYQIYIEGTSGTSRHAYPIIDGVVINAASGATAHIYCQWTDHARINPLWADATINMLIDSGANTALWTNYIPPNKIAGGQASGGGFDSYGLNQGGGSPDRLYFCAQAADIAPQPGGRVVLPNSDANLTDLDHITGIINEVQLSGVDISAGNTTLRIDTEGTGATLTGQPDIASTKRVKIYINGVLYTLLAE